MDVDSERVDERICLTPTQFQELVDIAAERAAEKAVELLADKAYQQVGRAVVDKAMWLIGLMLMAAGYWLNSKGLVKWPP